MLREISNIFILLLIFKEISCLTPPESAKNKALEVFNDIDHDFDPQLTQKNKAFMLIYKLSIVSKADDKNLLNILNSQINGFFNNMQNVENIYNKLWSAWHAQIPNRSDNPSYSITLREDNEMPTNNAHVISYLESQNQFAIDFSDFQFMNNNFTAHKDLLSKCDIIDDFKSLIIEIYEIDVSSEIAGLIVQLYNFVTTEKLTGDELEKAKKKACDNLIIRLTRSLQKIQKSINLCIKQHKQCR